MYVCTTIKNKLWEEIVCGILSQTVGAKQGDQIGRIFAYWAIVDFG
jgi:hypothetical protein